MNQSTRKAKELSLVSSVSSPATAQQPQRTVELKDSFDGWLNSVAPTPLPSPSTEEVPVVPKGRRSLTSIDIMRVNRATIRESFLPRLWPPDVVLTFLAADVIKRNKQ